MLGSIIAFFQVRNLKKTLTFEQQTELFDYIKRMGVKEGYKWYQNHLKIKKHYVEVERQAKISEYARTGGRGLVAQHQDKNNPPTDKEILAARILQQEEKYGFSYTVREYIRGWACGTLSYDNGHTDVIVANSKYSIIDRYKDLVNQREEAEKAEKKKQERVQRQRNPEIDISHVEKAMGIDKRNNNSGDIDDILKGLF